MPPKRTGDGMMFFAKMRKSRAKKKTEAADLEEKEKKKKKKKNRLQYLQRKLKKGALSSKEQTEIKKLLLQKK